MLRHGVQSRTTPICDTPGKSAFAQVPEGLIFGATPAAAYVWARVEDLCVTAHRRQCDASRHRLAADLGISAATVDRGWAAAVKRGYGESTRTGCGENNVRRIREHPSSTGEEYAAVPRWTARWVAAGALTITQWHAYTRILFEAHRGGAKALSYAEAAALLGGSRRTAIRTLGHLAGIGMLEVTPGKRPGVDPNRYRVVTSEAGARLLAAPAPLSTGGASDDESGSASGAESGSAIHDESLNPGELNPRGTEKHEAMRCSPPAGGVTSGDARAGERARPQAASRAATSPSRPQQPAVPAAAVTAAATGLPPELTPLIPPRAWPVLRAELRRALTSPHAPRTPAEIAARITRRWLTWGFCGKHLTGPGLKDPVAVAIRLIRYDWCGDPGCEDGRRIALGGPGTMCTLCADRRDTRAAEEDVA